MRYIWVLIHRKRDAEPDIKAILQFLLHIYTININIFHIIIVRLLRHYLYIMMMTMFN